MGFCPLFWILGTNCQTGDKMGTNCPQALCIKGFRAFLFVPCYGFSEGQNGMKPWPERVYGFLSPVFDTGDKMPDRGQILDSLWVLFMIK